MKQPKPNNLPRVFQPLKRLCQHCLSLGAFIAFAAVYASLILQVNQLHSREPTAGQVSEQLKTIQRPSVDEATLAKIKQLQDQNIQVKALFDQARKDPFAE